MTAAETKNQTPNEVNRILSMWDEFTHNVKSLYIESEAVRTWAGKDGEIQTATEPTRAKLWCDGLRPTKFRVEYSPRLTPYLSAKASFAKENVMIAYDGTAITELTTGAQSIGAGMIELRQGRIANGDPDELSSHCIETGLAFTFQGSAIIAGGVNRDSLSDRDSMISCSTESTGEMRGFLVLKVRRPAFGTETRIWIDPAMKYGFRRVESVTYPVGDKALSRTTFDVLEFVDLGAGLPCFPVHMVHTNQHYEKLKWKTVVRVNRVSANAPWEQSSYRLSFPIRTRVSDERIGMSFVVGSSLPETLDSIKKQADGLRLDLPPEK